MFRHAIADIMHIIANVRLIAQQIAELTAIHVERTKYVNWEAAVLVVLSIMYGIMVVKRIIVTIVDLMILHVKAAEAVVGEVLILTMELTGIAMVMTVVQLRIVL